MDKKLIAVTANGLEVYAEQDLYEKHMAAHADVKLSDIAEAVRKVTSANYNGQFGMLTIDLEREIGVDSCVEVTESDAVRHLYRKDRKGASPCLLNRKGNPTSLITIGICKDDDGKQTLFTAFYGKLAPKEPWDYSLTETERTESVAFWRTHALCVDSDAIDWEMSLARDVENCVNLEDWGFTLESTGKYKRGGIEVSYLDGKLISCKIQGWWEIVSRDSNNISYGGADFLWDMFASNVRQAKAFINSGDIVEEFNIKGGSDVVIFKDICVIEVHEADNEYFDVVSLRSASDLLGGIDEVVNKNEAIIKGKKWKIVRKERSL